MKLINQVTKQVCPFGKELVDMMIGNLAWIPGIDSAHIHDHNIGS